ncbi:immunoglobulin i-set domain-containing protein [Ditylenchus destructor]|uniref:Immunoglobulin i-set domain-containing protein n=1 Tax=Ditylenchus destructor TaxID=166010 RepID=A0AAD4R7B6_9BILA|nr:immunoglobulin i-set domain-containing protein [Ditylenchus destructor]
MELVVTPVAENGPTEAQPNEDMWKSTTTISTISVQARPDITMVIAMLKSLGYYELRIDEMKPKMLEIGSDLGETSYLLNSHNDLFSRLTSKQQQVEELLERAQDLVTQQTEQDDVVVYEAMADGLGLAWKELTRQLELRGYILTDTLHLYELADKHEHLNKHTNSMLRHAIGLVPPNANSEQIQSEVGREAASNLQQIVGDTQNAINELIGLTATAVDIGSNIIGQIRVLGALADNYERAGEVAEACLIIEKVMLRMAQQWEMIDNFWTEERSKFDAVIGTPAQVIRTDTQEVPPSSAEHIVAHLNALEAWLDAAKQTLSTTGGDQETVNLLLGEVKTQKQRLEQLKVDASFQNLVDRRQQLLANFADFIQTLDGKSQIDNRVAQFLQNADSMLHQLDKMGAELVNANAPMAGELGPLAHQKAGALIDEGEHLLQTLGQNDAVSNKVAELKEKLMQVEQMARDRIAWAKTANQKLQAQLSSLSSWLKDVAETFMSQNGHLGSDYSSCSEFVNKHKQFTADAVNKEPEVLSVLNHAQELAAPDRRIMVDVQNKYEKLRQGLEVRLQLGRNFEQVLKFAKELDASFENLDTMIGANNRHYAISDPNISQRVRNVIQLVHETLQQERHQGDKFIANARSAASTDSYLNAEDGIGAIQKIVGDHERRLAGFSHMWEEFERSKFDSRKALQVIEEVQMWQIETTELIRIMESQKPQTPEDHRKAENQLENMISQASQQTNKLNSAQSLILQSDPSTMEKAADVERKQKELEGKIREFKDQVVRMTVEETFIETRETLKAPVMISPLMDSQDTVDVRQNPDYRTSFVDGVATLTIEETFIEDSAVYKIRAANGLGSAESEARLVVKSKSQLNKTAEQIGADKPHFVRQLQNVNINEGEIAVLDCVVVANPEPTIIWFKEEETIQESDRIHLQFQGDHCILSIYGASAADSGLYKVKAVNPHGETTNFCRLNVTARKMPPQTPPYVEPTLANQIVSEGQKVQFRIHVSGVPTPNFAWTFQDQPIPQDDPNVQVVNEADGWTRVTIERAMPQYAGIYMIVASNELGEARSGASLNVIPSGRQGPGAFPTSTTGFYTEQISHETTSTTTRNVNQIMQQERFTQNGAITGTPTPPPIPKHRGSSAEKYLMGEYVEKDMGDMGYSSIANAPEFAIPFQNEYTVNEGEKVKIDCLMVGNPRPRVNWYFNDKPIKSNWQVAEFTNIGDTYSICFSPAKLENAGYYRMTAENIRGKTESLTLIHVRPKALQQQTSMIPQPQKLKKTHSLEHNRLMNEFALTGHASSIPRYERFAGGTPPPTKRVHPAVPSGQMTTSAYQPSGQPPHFIQALVSIVGTVGESAKFETIVTGYPAPNAQWSKDGVPLSKENAPNVIFSNVGGRLSLTFQNLSMQNAGKYMCIARNAFGMATSSAQLVVRARTIAPDFIKRLISEEVMEGERLKWSVKVSGDPEPSVTWLRDGQLIPNCEEVKLIGEGDGVYAMVIERVETADGGQFTCLLENEAGEARSTADLVIRPPGAEPGSYFHITKVTQEKQLKGEEVARNQSSSFSIQSPRQTPP